MAVKTPKEWQEERFQPLVEATTFYGNKVMIPEKCLFAWEIAEAETKEMLSKGMDPVDGLEAYTGMRIVPYKVYLEIFE